MIYIGADHRGFSIKSKLLAFFTKKNLTFEDRGAYVYSEKDDFNDPAISVATAVREHPGSFGILICGSAHGMIIQANRFKGIRAITATTPELVKIGRIHNDANILCLSADHLSFRQIKKFITIFINTKFNGGAKYLRRINRLDEREDHA